MQPATTYASAALLIMGLSSLILAALFRSKFKKLKELSKAGLSANIYSKTFVVFDPYAGHRKIIHSYLPIWALTAGLASLAASLASFVLVGMGFGLSIFTALAGLSLIVMDDAFDVYKNSNIFINAIRKGSSLGVGDLKVLSTLKVYTWRLGYYYLGVAAFLTVISLALPYILNQAMLILALFMGGIVQASSSAGFGSFQLAVFLFAAFIVLFEALVAKIKSQIFKSEGV
ncbi:MAG: hypothetical protein QXU45_02895 [Candidatus Bathyarchaeia archaeon]